jgi:predicted regulator of Ras-like GTPase activity (Roadblock/LC7/MglB family)
MTGFLKKVFGKAQSPAESHPVTAPVPPPAPAPQAIAAPVHKVVPLHKNGGHQNGKGIELPLQPVLAGLPLELQPRLKQPDVGSLTISVPLEKILSQLSRGTVKISFGELRQAAPGLFTNEADRDRVWVTLPLSEILPRLNPALIMRRREQKQVEVPEEISSPFDAHGRGLVLQAGPAEPEQGRATAPAPGQPPVAPAAPVTLPNRNNITFAATPAPPMAMPLNTPPMTSVPRARQPVAHARAAAQAPAPAPTKPPAESAPLVIALSTLAESWPESVRKEIVQHNLVEAKVELPCDVVERALRQGRIAFTWKVLRSWMKPAPRDAGSAEEARVLELPLKIVAPLFLARQQEVNATKRKVTVDEDIPNLFFGFPQQETGGAKVSRTVKGAASPQDTNYYVWDDSSDRVREQEPGVQTDPSPGTKFVAKYATPNEVVSRAAALDGVAGALIALPDGLMVASRLAPDLNGDTLAAFLPQIFGKVNQCTKELRMGELNNLNFTVGNVPWKIFRVNAIFFAAFGRAAEPLPTAQLAALAAELDHKPK